MSKIAIKGNTKWYLYLFKLILRSKNECERAYIHTLRIRMLDAGGIQFTLHSIFLASLEYSVIPGVLDCFLCLVSSVSERMFMCVHVHSLFHFFPFILHSSFGISNFLSRFQICILFSYTLCIYSHRVCIFNIIFCSFFLFFSFIFISFRSSFR